MKILSIMVLLLFAPVAASAQDFNLNFNVNSMKAGFQDILREARAKGFDVDRQWREIEKVLDYLFDNHSDIPTGQLQESVKRCTSLVMSKVNAKTAVVSADEIISCLQPTLPTMK